VRDHLGAMQRRAPALASLYKEMARQTIAVARDSGNISQDTADELVNLVL
jgi:hypothetical protein